MESSLTQEIINPHALSPAERERVTDELYAAHDQIFAGVSRAAFAAYVVDSPAERTRIQVLRSRGQVVGYAAFHAFERTVAGQRALILRAEVGLFPEYRRRTRCGWFLAKECIGAILRNPGRRVWGLSCATNPATYRSIARHTDQVWPHWEQPTPDHVQQLMTEMADQFGLQPVDEQRPGVYHVGWKTRQSEAEALGWRHSTDPVTRLYVDRNPDFAQGHGLLLLVPLTRLGIMRTVMRLIDRQIRRRLSRRPMLPSALRPPSLRSVEAVWTTAQKLHR